MIDDEKIFKALKLGKVTGLGCTLTSAECDYLIAHDDVLTQYITLLEKEQRWIPVGERLPDTNANVMVNASNEQLIGSYHSKHGIWYIPSVDRPKVSHWMPLPGLPEVNNE